MSEGAVELLAEDDGVHVIRQPVGTVDADAVVIPWDQAVELGRRLISLARGRGDVS